MYPKVAKQVHVFSDMYPKREKWVHVVSDRPLVSPEDFTLYIIGECVVRSSLLFSGYSPFSLVGEALYVCAYSGWWVVIEACSQPLTAVEEELPWSM